MEKYISNKKKSKKSWYFHDFRSDSEQGPEPDPFFSQNGTENPYPDPYQNETDPQHCIKITEMIGY